MEKPQALRSRPQPQSVVVQPSKPETVQWELQEIQLGIARRAYELFEMRNQEHGHDWEDWFRAESELVRPVSVAVSDSPDHLSVRINVLGFEADEIKTAIESRRIAIVARKKLTPSVDGQATPEADAYPDQLQRIVDLAADIDPNGAVVEWKSGVLMFELPKLVKSKTVSMQAA